jgi:hypothetical protein
MQNGEDGNGSKLAGAFSKRSDHKFILLLCILAAIHVFVFSAAFPFFNNVDEPMHFDLVVKYSHGRIPRGKEMISPDSATYIALFSSCAYFGTPDKFPGGKMPSPPWTVPSQQMRQDLAINSAAWQSLENYEVSQAPLYYVLTGSVWHLGQRLNIDSAHLLYWLRFVNVCLVVALVWLAYIAARFVFPENVFICLGTPAILAFMPQTAFYSIGNDILSPLCFGAVFVLLVKWLSCETSSISVGAAMGFAFAATYLSKTTNLPLLAVVAAWVVFKLAQDIRNGKFRAACPALVSFLFSALLPIAGWMFWCEANFGDFTGSKLKMGHFGWTVKPFDEWWHHPIFTPGGLWTYLSGQLSTFWQGEFLWHNQPLALPGSNVVYIIFSLVLMAAAALALFRKDSNVTVLQRRALQFGIACIVAGLAFFGFMSIVYDFHDCPNPSREHPYFQAGRMLLGMLIPFLLVIMCGLDHLLKRAGDNVKWLFLVAIALFMLASEITTDWSVFHNEFNWYHLP